MIRLQTALEKEISRDGGALKVTVAESCGAIDVRVAGPTGNLKLRFDRADLNPAFVRHVIRRTVNRYGASLNRRPDQKDHWKE
jgi:hypothetical protein